MLHGAAAPTAASTSGASGGMKIERTWFAADKTGFHMLHTLFQTSPSVSPNSAL